MSRIEAALFPRKCVLCRADIPEQTADGLCPLCREALEWEQAHMTERMLVYADVIAVGVYKGTLRAAVLRTKEGNNPSAIPAMQTWVCRALARQREDFVPEVVTFVPSSPLRTRKRGFILPEELAKAVAKQTGAPMRDLFRHTLFSRRQAGMSGEERKQHAKQSIVLRRGADVTGKKVLLVDDIIASGSTMDWCAKLLHEAGASEVVGLALVKSE